MENWNEFSRHNFEHIFHTGGTLNDSPDLFEVFSAFFTDKNALNKVDC